ncbi:uncharacterized protein GIQ15_03573 [Arthroderma uncinatum]|uniref:uncharacterized protein n=1 Tax=Arthroderma uncinatum TaxID=74035 RepID=UPI00144A7AF0|nr:uncharacterized protein GIQ15_03573 [Arthroderma uncinatum]KAF3484249.1 hypothetical protein GIQ15_03573 [Arthroderma uncinatum]
MMDVDAPLFNPAKRRKFMRRRADDAKPEDEPDTSGQRMAELDTRISPVHDDMETDDTHVADIVRLRKPHRVRKGGIEFSTSRLGRNDSLIPASEAVADEAEMAKRRLGTLPSETADPTDPTDHDSRRAADNTSAELHLPQRQPATLGKLHEIDLGPDSKLQNIARTEAATRNLVKGDSATPEGDDDTFNKTRLDKDGKPIRSSRRRRNSEDVMRDRLVEEVLRESKLDVYEEPQRLPLEDDQAADDRIADQFRRDFLDAIHSRRRGARTRNTKTTKTDAPRGPKLGGSRSARAAMREQQSKAQK